MMNLFRQPKPRRFEHINIYADDRRERLRRMEQRVREELARKDGGGIILCQHAVGRGDAPPAS